MKHVLVLCALCVAGLPNTVLGQAPSVSGAYARPVDDMPHDSASYPEERDIRLKGTRDASDDQAAKRARRAPAEAADILVGSEVRDSKGVLLGTVETVEADGAVIMAEKGKVKVPLEAFGKNAKGLIFQIRKSEFDAMVAAAVGSSTR